MHHGKWNGTVGSNHLGDFYANSVSLKRERATGATLGELLTFRPDTASVSATCHMGTLLFRSL